MNAALAGGREQHSSPRLLTPQFLAVASCVLVFFLHAGIVIDTVPRYVEGALGWQETGTGLAMLCFAASAVFARPLISSFARRFGNRAMMASGALLAAVSLVLIASWQSMPALLLGRAFGGIGEAALFVGATTIVTGAALPEHRAQLAAYMSIGVFVGIGVGPAIAGLFERDAYSTLFLVAAAVVALSGALARAAVGVERPAPMPGEVLDGVSAPVTEAVPRIERLFPRAALLPGAVLGVGMAAFSTFAAFIPTTARSLGFGASGTVFAIYAIGCIVARVAGASLPQRLGLSRSSTCALGGLGTALLALSVSRHVSLGIPTIVLLSAGISLLYPALLATAVNASTETNRVAVVSTFTMFFEVGTAVGGVTFGALADVTSKRLAFAVAGALAFGGIAYLRTVVVPWTTRQTQRSEAINW